MNENIKSQSLNYTYKFEVRLISEATHGFQKDSGKKTSQPETSVAVVDAAHHQVVHCLGVDQVLLLDHLVESVERRLEIAAPTEGLDHRVEDRLRKKGVALRQVLPQFGRSEQGPVLVDAGGVGARVEEVGKHPEVGAVAARIVFLDIYITY